MRRSLKRNCFAIALCLSQISCSLKLNWHVPNCRQRPSSRVLINLSLYVPKEAEIEISQLNGAFKDWDPKQSVKHRI